MDKTTQWKKEIREHRAYRLKGRKIVSRIASNEEVENASNEARAKLKNDTASFSLRSCWVCNAAHSHFLEDLTDGYLFQCFGCGHWYYQGVDLTGGPHDHDATCADNRKE